MQTPSKYGRVHVDWLKESRIKTTTLTSFAGNVLTLVPIIYLFFCEFCQGDALVADFMELFKMLHFICGILSTGPELPMRHRDDLRTLLVNFHRMYARLFEKVKPKLHHMHHVIDHMDWLGKLLACFVTERKHRTVKDAALHVFRFIEHTVLVDVVNKHCEQITHGFDLFEHTFLERPSACKQHPNILRSSAAVLPCGRICANDLVFFDDMTCGRVVAFFLINNEHFMEVKPLGVLDNDPSLRTEMPSRSRFVACAECVDSCTWCCTRIEGVLRVCVPPILLLRR